MILDLEPAGRLRTLPAAALVPGRDHHRGPDRRQDPGRDIEQLLEGKNQARRSQRVTTERRAGRTVTTNRRAKQGAQAASHRGPDVMLRFSTYYRQAGESCQVLFESWFCVTFHKYSVGRLVIVDKKIRGSQIFFRVLSVCVTEPFAAHLPARTG